MVTRDVADFAVVAGAPARQIRLRFSEATCQLIRESRWWEKTLEELRGCMAEMVCPLPAEPRLHPLLRR